MDVANMTEEFDDLGRLSDDEQDGGHGFQGIDNRLVIDTDSIHSETDVAEGERVADSGGAGRLGEDESGQGANTSTQLNDVSPLSEDEYQNLEKKYLGEVKFSDSELKYLTQYLLYVDGKKRVDSNARENERNAVKGVVTECLKKIKIRLKQHPEFSGGDAIECGSFYEHTKVGDPHEFDYQYILPLESYTAEVAEMSKTKSKRSNLESRTFFRLYKTEVNTDGVVAGVKDTREGAIAENGGQGATAESGGQGATAENGEQGAEAGSGSGEEEAMAENGEQGATAENGGQGATAENGRQGATAKNGEQGATAENGGQGATAENGEQGAEAGNGSGKQGPMAENGEQGDVAGIGVQGAKADQGAVAGSGEQGANEEVNKTTATKKEIVAKNVHDAFQATLERILKDLFPRTTQPMTKKSGPAVKFVLKVPHEDPSRPSRNVKVDVTVGYRVSPDHTFFEDVKLRTYAEYLRDNQRLQCHFIPAHDFWKLSFTENEKELMTGYSAVGYRGVCYRAIKILRDAVDVQDALGDGILGSYPIKVTHMKKTFSSFHPDYGDDEWTDDELGRRVVDVVRSVDYDGSRQEMHGIFIRGDNILGESDKSYLESRRILNKLKTISTGFRRYALVNCIIWLLMMISSAGLLVAEIAVWAQTDWDGLQKGCINVSLKKSPRPPFPFDLPFLFGFSVLVWINMLANLAGVLFTTIVTRVWNRDVFRVLPNLMYVFIITLIASFILAVFDVYLLADYTKSDSCTHLADRVTIEVVAGVSIVITLVPATLLLISCINNAIYYKALCTESCSFYDVIFFEFPFCRKRIGRLTNETLEDELTEEDFQRMGSLRLSLRGTLHDALGV